MGISHETILGGIESDYPGEVQKMAQYEGVTPPVSKEYLRELCGEDPELIGLFDDMIEYFYRYTRDVCAMESLKHEHNGIQENLEEIRRLDSGRTTLHNATIDAVKIFARNLQERGKDTSWIADIDKKGRIGYANLALLTTFTDILHHHNVHD